MDWEHVEIYLGRVGGNTGRDDHISLLTGKEFSKNNLKINTSAFYGIQGVKGK